MIGIYYIATGEYTQFFDGFIRTLSNFYPEEEKVVSLMADESLSQYDGVHMENILIQYHHINHYPWPTVTLYKFWLMKQYKIVDARLHFYCNSNILFHPVTGLDWNIFNTDKIMVVQHAAGDINDKSYCQGGSICIPNDIFDDFCNEHIRRVNEYMQEKFVVPTWHDETILNEMLIRDNCFPYEFFPSNLGIRWHYYDGSPNPHLGLCYLRDKAFQQSFKHNF